jgi:hypothetical protein
MLLTAALAASAQPQAQPQPQAQTKPQGQAAYMSQAYVDTTVMRALYILNESASGYSVNNNRQTQAVERAKAVLDDLRKRAKGDPNERYALMRISEVEMQIALELEEIRKIEQDRRTLAANQLVTQYNAEVGKLRPDFATMRGLYRRMAEVDTRQANNMADSYNKRYKQISREATHSLEKALAANDFDIARRELEYCEKNKNYLMISSAQLAAQRERLERIQSAHGDLPRVTAQLDDSEKAYREFRLSECRMYLNMANNRLGEIRAHIPAKDAGAATARAQRLIRALDSREDSLVNIAMGVLNKQGPDAAVEYLHEVLQKRMSLSPERASIVDQAIMQARPERAPSAESNIKMVDAPDIGASDNREMALIQDRARYRAQERADSVRQVKNKAASIKENIYMLIENKRQKDASRLFANEKAFLSSVLDKSDFRMLEQSVSSGTRVAASAPANKDKARAELYTARIYALIERNEIKEAFKRFKQYRKPLNKHLDSETFQMLELTVTQSYEHMAKNSKRR